VFKYKSENKVELIFFNLLMDELTTVNNIEKMRIYKNDMGAIKFNPNKDLIIKFFKEYFPRVDLIFPETSIEKKIGEIVVQGVKDAKAEVLKGEIIHIKTSVKHQGIIYDLGENEQGPNTIGINYTSQKKTLGLENISLKEDSYITKGCLFDKKEIKLDISKVLTDLKDSRILAEQFDLQECALISSLGLKDLYNLNYDIKTQKFIAFKPTEYSIESLKSSIKKYGGKPNDSILYDLDIKLREIYSELSNIPIINQEIAFKYAITTILTDENNFEKFKLFLEMLNK
jgi:hypothetical protein